MLFLHNILVAAVAAATSNVVSQFGRLSYYFERVCRVRLQSLHSCHDEQLLTSY